jgi:hypothetical protein
MKMKRKQAKTAARVIAQDKQRAGNLERIRTVAASGDLRSSAFSSVVPCTAPPAIDRLSPNG